MANVCCQFATSVYYWYADARGSAIRRIYALSVRFIRANDVTTGCSDMTLAISATVIETCLA